MGTTIRLAMIQQAYAPFDRDANYAKAEAAIRCAAERGAQIICTPEMFLTGYPNPTNEQDWNEFVGRIHETAEPVDGEYAGKLAAIAGELGVYIVAGVCESRNGKLYNSAFFFSADGRHIGTYSKVHVCRFSKMEDLCADGDDWYVWPVGVAGRTVRVGIMICYDREHPESARVLMLKGAQVILVPNACGVEEKRLGQLQARAFENAVTIAMANHSKPHNGHSVVFDHEGNQIAIAGDGEAVLIADIDIDAQERYERDTIWGDHYRRREKYRVIAETNRQ